MVSFCIVGWLWKQGGRYKSWKRRWFILNDNCLYYFEFTTDKEPRGIIPLENIRVREVSDRSKQHCFELFSANNEVIKACKTDSEGKVVEGKHSVYRMSASTEEEKDEWIKCIQWVVLFIVSFIFKRSLEPPGCKISCALTVLKVLHCRLAFAQRMTPPVLNNSILVCDPFLSTSVLLPFLLKINFTHIG